MLGKILKIIYPPKCVLCEKIIEDEDTLCSECWKKIKFIEKPYCNKCATPLDFKVSEEDLCLACLKNEPLYIKSRSAVVYEGDIARIIFKFKFYDKLHLKRFMAKSIVKASQDILNNIHILIPVPLHKKRLIFRKYNQSLLLADEISKLTNKLVIPDFLHKTKHTQPQAHLKQSERKLNLKDKFVLNKNYIKDIEKYKGLNFAIIDDVMTTGSTINECIKVLNKAGIKNVYSLTFAKTILQ